VYTQLQTKRVPFTYKRRGFFYFSRRIPNDLLDHYDTDRIVEGLKTRSASVAKVRSLMAAAKLEEYWHQLRVANPNLPGVHRLKVVGGSHSMPTVQAGRDDLGPKLSQSLEVYFRHKGQDKCNRPVRPLCRGVREADSVHYRWWTLRCGRGASDEAALDG
jgi:hypothetical protein